MLYDSGLSNSYVNKPLQI